MGFAFRVERLRSEGFPKFGSQFGGLEGVGSRVHVSQHAPKEPEPFTQTHGLEAVQVLGFRV